MSHMPVRVSTLRGDLKIPFDLYVFINQKYIHYVRKGASFEGERLQKLKQKKLKKLFILPEDETNYRKYVEDSLEEAYNSTKKDIHIRTEVVQGQQQSNTEALMENPEVEENYKTAKNGANKYVDFLLKEDGALKSLMAISNVDGSLAHHGVTVSGLSVQLGQKLGLETKMIKQMALGGLIHDYGHTLQEIDIARPLDQLSPDELVKYKDHPRLGAQKVKDLQHFEQTVVQIIMEHEELSNGTGFPQKLMENKIAREALIVGVANAFDRAMTFEARPAADAMKHISIAKLGLYPLEYLNNLKAILKDQGVI